MPIWLGKDETRPSFSCILCAYFLHLSGSACVGYSSYIAVECKINQSEPILSLLHRRIIAHHSGYHLSVITNSSCCICSRCRCVAVKLLLKNLLDDVHVIYCPTYTNLDTITLLYFLAELLRVTSLELRPCLNNIIDIHENYVTRPMLSEANAVYGRKFSEVLAGNSNGIYCPTKK